MLSKTTEYALRAAVYLCHSSGHPVTAQDIADSTQVPVRYMSKVLQMLAQAGVVLSQRGPTGGFTLARDPAQTTMLDVVLAVEDIPRITSCPLGLPEHEHQLCTLHKTMDEMAECARKHLGETTLEDLMAAPLVPLGRALGLS